MNSPSQDCPTEPRDTTTIDDAFSSQLASGLQAALLEREDATPEPLFEETDDGIEQHQYLCTLLRRHFKPSEAERLRQSIADARYWRCEAELFQAKIQELLCSNLCEETKTWRTMAKENKNACRLLGFTQDQINQHRLQISNPEYWETEKELFETRSRIAEYNLRKAARRKRARIPPPISPVSSRTRSKVGRTGRKHS